MSRTKVSLELKCQICEDYLSSKYTIRKLCHMYGIVYNEKCSRSSINDWVRIYNEVAMDGFKSSIGNGDLPPSNENIRHVIIDTTDTRNFILDIFLIYLTRG